MNAINRNSDMINDLLTFADASAFGLLIRAFISSLSSGGRGKFAIDGSGVESRNEAIYCASAISRFCSMLSRSAISTGSSPVSLCIGICELYDSIGKLSEAHTQ